MVFFVSQYLNLYPSHRNSMILFNGITGAIDEVSLDFGKLLAKYKNSRLKIPGTFFIDLSVEEQNFLLKRGHLTKLNFEEEKTFFIKYIQKLDKLLDKQRQRKGYLMLLPTYYCNLRCPYCFQKDLRPLEDSRHEFMSSGFVDEIFHKIVPQLFPNIRGLDHLSVCLYGGEPFLLENRESLERIFYHTRKHQIEVDSFSNATQIDNCLDFFGATPGLVNHVQISFDGDKPFHDKSRIGIHGEETFDKIIENIHRLVEKKVRISIRINSTRESVKTITNFIRKLKEEELLDHPFINVYAWAVYCHGEPFDRELYVRNWELSNIVENISPKIESPIGRRERRLRRVLDVEGGLILRRTSHCMRNLTYSHIIDLHGDIYGCYEDAGNKELRTGYYSRDSKKVVFEKKYYDYQARNVSLCEPCNQCGVALTCGGGCADAAQAEYGSQFHGICDSHKACVAKAVQRLFKNKVENKGIEYHDFDMSEIISKA